MNRRPPFKCHGGKFYSSQWILSFFPEGYENMVYIEPYAGAGSVFLNKKRSAEEGLNDLDKGVVDIFRALRDEPDVFTSRLKKLSYSEETFNLHLSKKEFDDYLDHAVSEFVLRRMSRGGLKKHFAWSERLRGGQPGDINAWKTILEELPSIAEETKNAYIMNEKAIKVINVFNHSNTLVYIDPPYLPETRVSQDIYTHEMDTDDHIELSEILNSFKGKVILSGYPSKLYKRLYDNVKVLTKDKTQKSKWRCERKIIANHASQCKNKEYKTEMLWLNF
jgi:DNA adenine methylase